MTDTPTPWDVIARAISDATDAWTGNFLPSAILSALTAAGYVVEQGWQPIETAPRDGTVVQLWCTDYRGDGGSGVVFSAQWEGECWVVPQHDSKRGFWCDCLVWEPTHWRPLPAGPITEGDAP